MFEYVVASVVAFVVCLIPGMVAGTIIGIVFVTRNARIAASFVVSLAFASLIVVKLFRSTNSTEAFIVWVIAMFAITLLATKFGNDLPASAETAELDRKGDLPAAQFKLIAFLLVSFVSAAALFAWPAPYEFQVKSFEISKNQNPRLSSDLLDATCPLPTPNCDCVMRNIYSTTSDFERHLLAYTSWPIPTYRVWLGARNAGLTTTEVIDRRRKINATVDDFKRQCAAASSLQ